MTVKTTKLLSPEVILSGVEEDGSTPPLAAPPRVGSSSKAFTIVSISSSMSLAEATFSPFWMMPIVKL